MQTLQSLPTILNTNTPLSSRLSSLAPQVATHGEQPTPHQSSNENDAENVNPVYKVSPSHWNAPELDTNRTQSNIADISTLGDPPDYSASPGPSQESASRDQASPQQASLEKASPEQGWQDPAFPQLLLRNLEDFSGAFRASVTEQSQLKSELHYTGQQMSQIFGAMSQLLDMMYDRLVTPQRGGPSSQAIDTHSFQDPTSQDPTSTGHVISIDASSVATALAPALAPIANELSRKVAHNVAQTMDHGFSEISYQVHSSESRHLEVLQATLTQLQTDREIQQTAYLTQMESMRVHARLEFNRLLQVLLLGTAVALAGVTAAFVLMR